MTCIGMDAARASVLGVSMPSKRYKKNLAKVLRFAKKCVQTYLKTQLKPTMYVGTNVHIVGTCRCASCLRDLRTPSFAAGLCWHRSTQFNKLFRKAAHDNGFSLRLGSEPGATLLLYPVNG
jgi:hypothetical protein